MTTASGPPLRGPFGPLVPHVERIAVLKPGGIGDLVLALPALDALRVAYPDAEVTYLGTPSHVELLAGRPGPWDRVLTVPPYPGVGGEDSADRDSSEVRDFLSARRRERYDLALQLHGGGGNSNPFLAAMGARLTAGSRDAGAPPLDRWTPYTRHQHDVLRFLEVVALIGAVPVSWEPRLDVTDAEARAGNDALSAAGVPGAAPLVTVHPGARDPARRWPPERFAAVAGALAAVGAHIALVGSGADDAEAAARITAAMPSPPPVNLVGCLSLPAAAGVLARSALVVANDSGPRHLAAALGTATVGVFWCGNLISAGPLTRSRHRVGVSFRAACPDCGADLRSGCEHDPSLVADVPVDDVLAHAVDLFAGERPLPPRHV